MNLLSEISTMLTEYPDGKAMLHEPIRVKSAPHQQMVTIHGAWRGEDGIWLLDGSGDWHGPLLETQMNGIFIINSLFQRLKLKAYASPASN